MRRFCKFINIKGIYRIVPALNSSVAVFGGKIMEEQSVFSRHKFGIGIIRLCGRGNCEHHCGEHYG